MSNINQKNTFVSLSEQLAILNKNAVEIMTKLNDVVTNRNSTVDVNFLNSDGSTTTYYLPTVGQLKNELDVANRNIKKLAGLTDNNVYVSDGTTMRKVYVDDLNREPEPINDLNTVSTFVSINNSFFESLSNPMLAVTIDLTDKIDKKVQQILSRRYIVKFQKDDNGNLTTDAVTSKKDFETKFLNKNNIFIDDFTTWYNNVNNYGVLRANEPFDDQVFPLDYDELEYYGVFDIVGVDNDTINKKMWYTLGSLVYYDYSGNTKTLSIGDELIINKKNSATKWKVKEVSTAKSNYRIILERTEGLDPVPIMAQGLKIYSAPINQKSIKVSIGFDEYNIIFIKPINTDSNVISTTWSYGTCFYTNDLVLDTNNKIAMTKYYAETVFDYGTLLKDMIIKNIPSKFGKKPNTPVLNSANFKVVQINTHLTNTQDSNKLRELHSQKTQVQSRLQQLGDAITSKNQEVNMVQYKSTSDKNAAKNQLNTLISDQDSQTKLLTSIVNQISAGATTVNAIADPKFRIRGFWSFPEPILTGYEGYQSKQEVVQFKIQYRYSRKGGSEPTTEGFKLKLNETVYNSTTTTGDISDQTRAFTNPSVTTQTVEKTGYFSNWNEILTSARKRTYNPSLNVWTWEIEDVTNADAPNVNQLDISIQDQEQVEIKIQALSEVGWPDSPFLSDWSNVLLVQFPSDLSQLTDNSTILQEAQYDAISTSVINKFDAKGLTTHLQQSFFYNDQYVAHMDLNLGTSFKDDSGNMISLNQYLKNLTDRITTLEETILRSKGELLVKLFNNTAETIISNGASVQIAVKCEDYATQSGGTRTYLNNVYVITDFSLQFSNVAKSSQLGLLSYRKFIPANAGDNRFYNPTVAKGSLASYVNSNDDLNSQIDNQFLWISDASGTQPIYFSGSTDKALWSNFYNLGLTSTTGNTRNIFDDVSWSGVSNDTSGWGLAGSTGFLSTVHPRIDDISQFVYSDSSGVKYIDANTSLTIPINIYFQLSTGATGGNTVMIPQNATTSTMVTRKLRLFLEVEDSSRPFEFEIVFKIYRNRTYATSGNNINTVIPIQTS